MFLLLVIYALVFVRLHLRFDPIKSFLSRDALFAFIVGARLGIDCRASCDAIAMVAFVLEWRLEHLSNRRFSDQLSERSQVVWSLGVASSDLSFFADQTSQRSISLQVKSI